MKQKKECGVCVCVGRRGSSSAFGDGGRRASAAAFKKRQEPLPPSFLPLLPRARAASHAPPDPPASAQSIPRAPYRADPPSRGGRERRRGSATRRLGANWGSVSCFALTGERESLSLSLSLSRPSHYIGPSAPLQFAPHNLSLPTRSREYPHPSHKPDRTHSALDAPPLCKNTKTPKSFKSSSLFPSLSLPNPLP
jgi:hypothetical protein